MNNKKRSRKAEQSITMFAKELGYDPEEILSLTYDEDSDETSTNEQKRKIFNIALFKSIMSMESYAVSIIATMLSAVTGLKFEKKSDLVEYFDKGIPNQDDYAVFVTDVAKYIQHRDKQNEFHSMIDELMEALKQDKKEEEKHNEVGSVN